MGTRLAAVLALIPIMLSAVLAAVAPGPGTAPQPGAREHAIPLPTVRAEYSQGRLVLSGVLPDKAERDAIVRAATKVYGRDRVDDRLAIGAVANPAWLDPAFLPDLRGLSDAVAILEDAHLVVDGVAQSIQVHDRLGSRLASLMGLGVRVVNRVVVDARRDLR